MSPGILPPLCPRSLDVWFYARISTLRHVVSKPKMARSWSESDPVHHRIRTSRDPFTTFAGRVRVPDDRLPERVEIERAIEGVCAMYAANCRDSVTNTANSRPVYRSRGQQVSRWREQGIILGRNPEVEHGTRAGRLARSAIHKSGAAPLSYWTSCSSFVSYWSIWMGGGRSAVRRPLISIKV